MIMECTCGVGSVAERVGEEDSAGALEGGMRGGRVFEVIFLG